MLTHIVCWKYQPETTQVQRTEHITRLRDLVNHIPNIISLNVGTDVLHLDRSYNTGLVAIFPDRDALDAYTSHPAHQEVVAIGRAIAAHVVSVDFVE